MLDGTLLARFNDPTHGSTGLDARDYRDYDVESLQTSISVVFQNFARFDISAADNIGIGDVVHVENRERIIDAARKGGAEEVVNGLPPRYDTVLGGEWQNLAFARAFMSESQILSLDEPTSALDAFGEPALYDQFARLTENKTVIFISHRFSTVRMADTIVVLEYGRIIEQGDHETLMNLDGKYKLMFNTQAASYV